MAQRARLCGRLVLLALLISCQASDSVETTNSIASKADLVAEELVTASVHAMSVTMDVRAVQTLRFAYRSSGESEPVEWELRRPNLLRKQQRGAMTLVFDGTRAAFLEGPVREDGSLESAHLIPAADWHHFEMDLALYLPAYLDHEATYVGETVTQEGPASLLEVTLPMGGVVVYAIDEDTALPVRIDVPAWGERRHLGDYREVGGLLLPHQFTIGNVQRRMERLRVNVEIDRDRFRIPDELRD